jgi:predicted peroxiredoxin
MRGLTIIVATGDAERLHAALTFAAASAAAGAPTRLHLHGNAVALLAPPIAMPDDARHTVHGLPTLAGLFDDAFDLGVAITACQSGLALNAMSAEGIDPRIVMSGPVATLITGADDRLLSF